MTTNTSRLFAAEFVFPGHPDMLCDAIADSLVLEASSRERRALVGVEVAVHRNRVFVTGRIACADAAGIDVERIVRDVYRSAGYGDGWYPAPDEVVVDSHRCLGPLEDGEAEFRELSDDQAICVGYANNLAQTNHLPVEHWLVGRLARRLHALRREEPGLGLGPDGKVLVLVREDGASWTLESFSCSLQQLASSDPVALHRAVRLDIGDELQRVAALLPGLSAAVPDQLTVNGAGAFEVGGPEGDNGLSGKKLVMDAYGPRVPIGGGAWSGKDFFKADRAGGLHARRVAKLVVDIGLASEATVTLGWFPGDREARIIHIAAPSGQNVSSAALARCVDLSLRHSGENFPVDDLLEGTRWGHFQNPDRPWEQVRRI
jgi:S-adenosylmethionine synthetase